MCEKCEITHSTLLMALRAAGADAANRLDPPIFDLWLLLNQTFASLCRAARLPREAAEEAWLEGYQRLQEMKSIFGEAEEEEEPAPPINSPSGSA